MKTIKVYTEEKGWVIIDVARDFDRGFDKAKELEAELGYETRIAVCNTNGEPEWTSQ